MKSCYNVLENSGLWSSNEGIGAVSHVSHQTYCMARIIGVRSGAQTHSHNGDCMTGSALPLVRRVECGDVSDQARGKRAESLRSMGAVVR